ncbi:hypothetical protein ACFPPD_01500 [Cohnella suwonensis]|uniref:DNA translocase FtsK 4TM region domain-containing protein n=1 Tax=Cohnella suwonensis TaxID=696072 RepID=A0ABW0LNP6_9BACL
MSPSDRKIFSSNPGRATSMSESSRVPVADSRRNRAEAIGLAIAVAVSGALFAGVGLFTLEYRGTGHGISGNGNPGLLFVIPAVPAYAFLMVYACRISYRIRLHWRASILAISGLTLLILACAYGEYEKSHSLLRRLGGGPGDPDSVIYRFGWLNQYTNTLFFNVYTYLAGLSLAALIGNVVNRLRP